MNNLQVVDYTAIYKTAFKRLNEVWINEAFELEAEDEKVLNNPETYFINKGGFILIALLENEPVGTCAMVKTGPATFELCKMCVADSAQGNGIGYLICKAAIEKGRQLNAEKIWLETNSKLKPAIQLYLKLGFKQIPVASSKYKRVDTMMELLVQA